MSTNSVGRSSRAISRRRNQNYQYPVKSGAKGNRRCPRMVNEGILGGLKHAVAKGESLKQAMMTFYNAGYKKEEIEEATRLMQQKGMPEKVSQEKATPQKPEVKKKVAQKSVQVKRIPQRVSAYGKVSKPEIKPEEKQEEQVEKTEIVKAKSIKTSPQRVSNYEGKPKGKLVLILLISFLLFLIATLFAVIFFRRELIEFFNNIS